MKEKGPKICDACREPIISIGNVVMGHPVSFRKSTWLCLTCYPHIMQRINKAMDEWLVKNRPSYTTLSTKQKKYLNHLYSDEAEELR